MTCTEPDGYIQWEEIDDTALCTDRTPESPVITRIRAIITDVMSKSGLTSSAPQRVYDEISAARFQNVSRKTYTTVGKEALRTSAQKWVIGVIRVLVTRLMVVRGDVKDEEEAKQQVEGWVAEFEKHCETAMPLVNYKVTVAQKCE